ncbi:MAG: hypothetical protein ACKOFW_24090 [Planctomycetaceae bacterium]
MPPAPRPKPFDVCAFLRRKILEETAALKTLRQDLANQLKLIAQLKAEPNPDPQAIKAAEARAEALRQQISLGQSALETLEQELLENCSSRPSPRPGSRPPARKRSPPR